ncbi:hypothetical protein O181_057668 [Austropuccinia psidii MF-1]|uniref:Uncharacterized protein n=1 Tax=Austropuccinia psidii MF-1 TaxID=1389203 RepID=A0A9Q3EBP0_9BASI|nr:hypothetical protein [Austropuccinia psidii MF-1]
MDITLEPDTSYHERQKKKGHSQEKNPEDSKSSSSHPQNSSISNQKEEKEFSEEGQAHSSLLNEDFKLMGSEKDRRVKEGLCSYCCGKHSLESCFKIPQNQLAQPSGKFPSQGKALVKIMFCSIVPTVFHPEHNCEF